MTGTASAGQQRIAHATLAALPVMLDQVGEYLFLLARLPEPEETVGNATASGPIAVTEAAAEETPGW